MQGGSVESRWSVPPPSLLTFNKQMSISSADDSCWPSRSDLIHSRPTVCCLCYFNVCDQLVFTPKSLMMFCKVALKITCPTLSCHKPGSWVCSDVWAILGHKVPGSSPILTLLWAAPVSLMWLKLLRVWMRLSWDQGEQCRHSMSPVWARQGYTAPRKTRAPQLACYLVICLKKSYLCQLALGHVIPNFGVLSFCNLLPIILEDTHIFCINFEFSPCATSGQNTCHYFENSRHYSRYIRNRTF